MTENNLEQESDRRLEELVEKVKRKKDAERRKEREHDKAVEAVNAKRYAQRDSNYYLEDKKDFSERFRDFREEVDYRLTGKWPAIIAGAAIFAALLIGAPIYERASKNNYKNNNQTQTEHIIVDRSKKQADITTKLVVNTPEAGKKDTTNHTNNTENVVVSSKQNNTIDKSKKSFGETVKNIYNKSGPVKDLGDLLKANYEDQKELVKIIVGAQQADRMNKKEDKTDNNSINNTVPNQPATTSVNTIDTKPTLNNTPTKTPAQNLYRPELGHTYGLNDSSLYYVRKSNNPDDIYQFVVSNSPIINLIKTMTPERFDYLCRNKKIKDITEKEERRRRMEMSKFLN